MYADASPGMGCQPSRQCGGVGYLPDGVYTPLLFTLILFAVANRMYAVDFASLWSDELWGMWVCSLGSWGALLEDMVFRDSHPPGYQSLLYLWLSFFGDSDVSVRMPSVIVGVVAVYSVCVFASRYFSRLVGLLAAAFLATSFNAIYYSQEARAYSFILLFAIWHFHLFFLLFIEESNNKIYLVLFSVVGALLAYFHYVGVVIVASETPLLLLVPAFRRQLLKAIKAYGGVLLLYLPWFFVMMAHMLFPHESWERPVPDSSTLIKTIGFILGPDDIRLSFGVLALAFFILFSCVLWLKKSFHSYVFYIYCLLFLAFFPLLLFFVKSHVTVSAYTVRHFIFIIPVLMIVNAWAVERVFLWVFPVFGFVHVVVLLLLVVWGSQLINVSGSIDAARLLYRDSVKHEYREAAMVIASDQAFMQKDRRDVFASNMFFNHYLKRFGVRDRPSRFVREFQPERMSEYEQYIANEGIQDFYYMEILRNIEVRKYSPILQAFRKRYHAVCQSEFKLVRVLKFSSVLSPNPGVQLPRCPHNAPAPGSVVDHQAQRVPLVNEPPAGNETPALPAGQ